MRCFFLSKFDLTDHMKNTICFCMLLICSLAQAASYSIKSTIINNSNFQVIELASIRLLNGKDSTLITGMLSNAYGQFEFKKLPPSVYIVECRSLGFDPIQTKVTLLNKSIVLDTIRMSPASHMLNEFEVTENKKSTVSFNKDTMEFDATVFRLSENATVEDLLKRLPGVSLVDGAIKVNGETIDQILVDGKEFFKGNTNAATKNLGADMVEKVQVINKKSKQAELTGSEDEKTKKALNLVLKPNKRRGIFGNVAAAGGRDITEVNPLNRYSLNTHLNLMNGVSQTTIYGNSNNINSINPNLGMSNEGWSGSGYTQTQSIGIDNSSEINKSLSIGGSSNYSFSDNTTDNESRNENWILNDTIIHNSKSNGMSSNNSFNINMNVEIKKDSTLTVYIQPNFSTSNNQNNNTDEYEYFNRSVRTSWGDSENSNTSKNQSANMNVIVSKRSASRKGRSLNISVNGSLNKSESLGFNNSVKHTVDTTTVLNQKQISQSDNNQMNIRTSFVEPLENLKHFFETSVSFSHQKNHSNNEQFDFDPLTNSYPESQKDVVFSNEISDEYTSTSLQTNYRFVDKEFRVSGGFSLEPNERKNLVIYGNGVRFDTIQHLLNFSPTASINYNLSEKHQYLRLYYRGNISHPSIQQKQPVKNNSNQMYESIGNANLTPAFNHSVNLSFSAQNQEHFSSWNVYMYGNITRNAMVNNTLYDVTGKSYSQTVNTKEMPFNINGNIMYNISLFEQKMNVYITSNINYSQQVGYSGKTTEPITDFQMKLGEKSLTKSRSMNNQLQMSYANDRFDCSIRGNFQISKSSNTLTNKTDITNTSWGSNGSFNYQILDNVRLNTEVRYSDRKGYSTLDQTEWIVDAGVEAFLFKRITLTLCATDLLRKRLNFSHYINESSISYSKFNTLPSFLMLTVSCKINKFN